MLFGIFFAETVFFANLGNQHYNLRNETIFFGILSEHVRNSSVFVLISPFSFFVMHKGDSTPSFKTFPSLLAISFISHPCLVGCSSAKSSTTLLNCRICQV